MAVIATSTLENKKVINSENGILIEDNVEDFYLGLKYMYENMSKFNSERIRLNSTKYKWRNILNNLKRYLNSL